MHHFANKEATESRVPLGYVEVITSKVFHDLLDRYGISVSQLTTNMLHLS
jgi:hypothetical protein